MTLYVAMPDITAAIDADSLDWIEENAPMMANAISVEVQRGSTPDQIRIHVLREVGPHRLPFAIRCEQAARAMIAERAT